MGQGVRKLVGVAGISGEVHSLEQLFGELDGSGADAVAVVGDLGAPWSKADTYRAIFRALGEGNRPTFWVPGRTDAPLRDYLRESYNMEIAYPFLHGVHGTAALGPGDVLFAGMGGEISDDPETIRAEEALVRYAGWEVEYRLKVVREFEAQEQVFLFTTPPAHKGLREPGSEVLAELIKTYNPRAVIVGGEEPAEKELGRTLVVCPGRLDRGHYAVVDLHTRSVDAASLAQQAVV
jgi:Icc-related predicted phosphoesterase